MPGLAPRAVVLAPTPQLTITVESSPDGPQIHVHPGGQGVWLARMALTLGADVVVCGPFGGEAGEVAAFLARKWGIRVRATSPGSRGSGAYVHDRRGEGRVELARMPAGPLGRHEVDDLFGAVVVEALDADVVLLSGSDPAEAVTPTLYTRLATDLRAAGRCVVADVSGEALRAVVHVGVDALKVAHDELVQAGLARSEDVSDLVAGARVLVDGGVGAVVVTRAGDPALLVHGGAVHSLAAPPLTVVDHRGAGDSLTAALGVGLARGANVLLAARLGVAAGALNVTRHGLGSGARDQIERLSAQVEVRELAADAQEWTGTAG